MSNLILPPPSENLIVNPQCLIAQEGTSFAAMSDGDYALDGFKYEKSGSMVHTGSQVTDNPGVSNRRYNGYKSLKLDCTTADASIAAGDYCLVTCYVEGYDALRVLERSFVFTFWHKHTKTGTYCVAISNSGSDRTVVKEYTQSVTDTWEKATLIFPASPSAGTWDYSNGIGLRISFALACGSTYQTTADAWNTGNFFATSNQVNACDSTSNNFLLTDICLYPGDVDLGFYSPTFENQVTKCRRYFEKSYALAVDPGTAATKDAHFSLMFDTNYATQNSVYYLVEKRADVTPTLYNTQDGTAGEYSIYNLAGVHQSDQTGARFDNGSKGFKLSLAGNGVADQIMRVHFTADARF